MVSRALVTVPDCRVNFIGHVQPVDLACHGVVHGPLGGMSCQFRVMSDVEESLTKRIWHHSWYRTIEQGGES